MDWGIWETMTEAMASQGPLCLLWVELWTLNLEVTQLMFRLVLPVCLTLS